MTDAPEIFSPVSEVQGGVRSGRPDVGRVALIAAISLIASSLLLSVVLGLLGAPYVIRDASGPHFNFVFGDPDPVASALGLASPLHGLLGSAVGVWVIVQSIVAITLNRSRRAAIVALILAVVAPGLSLVLYLLIMLLPR